MLAMWLIRVDETMKLNSCKVLRPLFFIIVLATLVLALSIALIPYWYYTVKHIERHVDMNSSSQKSAMESEIQQTIESFYLLNSSATKFARVLSSSFHESQLSFSDIENNVAPFLFQALSTLPYITQVSYIGIGGYSLFYYGDENQTFRVFSNSSFGVNSSSENTRETPWYSQPINQDTGKPYGKVTMNYSSVTINASWFQEALNSRNGYASLDTSINDAHHDLLFLNSASVNGKGVISFGFPVKIMLNYLNDIDIQCGSLYLATRDGEVLKEGLRNTQVLFDGNSVSFEFMKPNGDRMGSLGSVSCDPKDGNSSVSLVNIEGVNYMFYCSPIDIAGVQSVYALAIPQSPLIHLLHKFSRMSLVILVSMIPTTMALIFSFIFILIRAAKLEMHICAALIKQMETTEQAERKSMNKSLAFASASHDIRAFLAAITGLIDICYDEVPSGSELEANLKQMEVNTKDLLGILNSILDTSKIEAGKMQLEEEEFDVSQLLEDVVDLFYPLGIKKGIDVVLDPCDCSIIKFSHVKGDRGKLKQILCNLLSNAIKFTSEGHVIVRAWARKPSFKNSITTSKKNGLRRNFSSMFYKRNKSPDEFHSMKMEKNEAHYLELVFEVDDTGKGIPKEKQKIVFENYVQVKETALGEGGTGLGLGIVQSLVHLMHGEIGIVDKEIGERGSCFRFNVLFTMCANAVFTEKEREDNIEVISDSISGEIRQNNGVIIENPRLVTVHTPSLGLEIRTPSSRLGNLISNPKVEGSYVVLLIHNNERRRISQKFMKNLGIKVMVVKQWKELSHTLGKVKHKWSLSQYSSSGKSNMGLQQECSSICTSLNSSYGTKDVSQSIMDGTDNMRSLFSKTNNPQSESGFILIVIDATSGPLSELCNIVNEFRNGLKCNACCKVVWLANPMLNGINFKSLEGFDPSDIIKYKPFHGTRLYEVVKMLPEFDSTLPNSGIIIEAGKVSKDFISPRYKSQNKAESEIQEDYGSISNERAGKIISSLTRYDQYNITSKSPLYGQSIRGGKLQEEYGSLQSDDKPLTGKKILVAEDSAVLRKLAMHNIARLGATAELCENGKEAWELVRNSLRNRMSTHAGSSNIFPYDYILMDCEMPIMNGYEATMKIRKEEEAYGVHIPIIALTAHTSDEEKRRTIEAGMNIHLCKPLKWENLLEAIRYIHSK